MAAGEKKWEQWGDVGGIVALVSLVVTSLKNIFSAIGGDEKHPVEGIFKKFSEDFGDADGRAKLVAFILTLSENARNKYLYHQERKKTTPGAENKMNLLLSKLYQSMGQKREPKSDERPIGVKPSPSSSEDPCVDAFERLLALEDKDFDLFLYGIENDVLFQWYKKAEAWIEEHDPKGLRKLAKEFNEGTEPYLKTLFAGPKIRTTVKPTPPENNPGSDVVATIVTPRHTIIVSKE